MTSDQEKFLGEVADKMSQFDLIFAQAPVNDKIRVAEDLQKQVDWIRFRAGMDKECYECRLKNNPDAKNCVGCGSLFICTPCALKSGYGWRCSHGGGFKTQEAIRMAKRPREEKAPVEEKVQRERFVLE